MNREERAKQFLPFDTLKGLREELLMRERKHLEVDKLVLSDTQKKEISDTLTEAKIGDKLNITYYLNRHYITVENTLTKIDPLYQYLILGDIKIDFDDLFKVFILKEEN